jgi:mono/diheme cytochrome c family protein
VKSLGPFFLILSVFAALQFAGCSSRGQGSAVPDAGPRMQGKIVYNAQCAQCHDATNLHLIKEPPKLDGMFQKSALPSGAPATDEEVRKVILQGRGIMPPFEQSVNGENLDNLMAYLHTR